MQKVNSTRTRLMMNSRKTHLGAHAKVEVDNPRAAEAQLLEHALRHVRTARQIDLQRRRI